MERKEVFRLIDAERDHQDALGASRTDGREHTVGEFLLMLEYYVDKARAAWTCNAGDTACLNEIRKCTAIGVHCMEHHGAPARVRAPFDVQ